MSLEDAKNPYGGQRFYRPGEHPATLRMREQLAWLKAANDRQPTRNAVEVIAYIERRLAEFEAGEDEAKRHYLQMIEPVAERRRASDGT